MLLKLKHEQQSSFVDNLISIEGGGRNWCGVSGDDYNDDGAWNLKLPAWLMGGKIVCTQWIKKFSVSMEFI